MVRCPKCGGSDEIYETGRDYVRCKVLAWQDDGWPAEVGEPELVGTCYDMDEEFPMRCFLCHWEWNPMDPMGGQQGPIVDWVTLADWKRRLGAK